MKLWEKTFLMTFVLFLIILDSSLFTLTVLSFQNDLSQAKRAAILEEKSVSYATANLYGTSLETRLLPLYLRYQQSGTRLRLSEDGRVIFDTIDPIGPSNIGTSAGSLENASTSAGSPKNRNDSSGSVENTGAPDSLPDSPTDDTASSEGLIGIVRRGRTPYLRILDTIYVNEVPHTLVYEKDLSSVYRNQAHRLLVVILASLLLSAAIGGILYAAMKNIYRPVENIAHELRTPLTGIKGYAQYLATARLSEEDRHFATSQILNESQNLQNIVEKLLIMGNLRKGSVECRPVSLEQLFSQLRQVYPNAEFYCGREQITGDETLLKSLFSNLIGNAVRTGGRVTVTADGECIRIWNSGNPLPEDLLKHLNRNTALPRQQIRENGLGVRLCHDIVKLHRGTLTYRSGDGTGEKGESGTLAIVEFPADIVQSK